MDFDQQPGMELAFVSLTTIEEKFKSFSMIDTNMVYKIIQNQSKYAVYKSKRHQS